MKAEWFDAGTALLRHTERFGGHRLTDVSSIDEVLAFRSAAIEAASTDGYPLLLLGNVDGAMYQAGHGLDDLEPFDDDLSVDDYVTHVERALVAGSATVDLGMLKQRVGSIDAPWDAVEMSTWNRDPMTMVDGPIWMLRVPVAEQHLAFVGAPVGNFFFVPPPHGSEAHYTPGPYGAFRLVQFWQGRFGMEFAGVGSLRLHFCRDEPFSAAEAAEITAAAAYFYKAPTDAELRALEAALVGRRLFTMNFRNQ